MLSLQKKKKAVRKTGPEFDILSGSGARYLSVKVSQVIAMVGECDWQPLSESPQ